MDDVGTAERDDEDGQMKPKMSVWIAPGGRPLNMSGAGAGAADADEAGVAVNAWPQFAQNAAPSARIVPQLPQ